MLKKTLSVLLTVLLVLSALPLAALPAFADPEPDPEPAETWTYDENTKTLTVSGELPQFDLEEYEISDLPDLLPWGSVMTEAEHLIVAEGITKIPEGCFACMFALQDAVLPATLTEIGVAAFAYDSSLKTVDLPAGLTSIGESAFLFTALEDVTVPGTVTDLGPAFVYCLLLDDVVLGEGMETVNYAFEYAAVNNLTVPSTLTSFESSVELKNKLVNRSAAAVVSDKLFRHGDAFDGEFYIFFMSLQVKSMLMYGEDLTQEQIEALYAEVSQWLLENRGLEITDPAEIDAYADTVSGGAGYNGATPGSEFHCLSDSAEHEMLRDLGYPHYLLDREDALCADPAGGKAGETIDWTIDADTGVLTLTGHGRMYDGSRLGYCYYEDQITSVSFVNEGGDITYLGTKAFADLPELRVLNIPEGVTGCGSSLIRNSGVHTLSIPSTLTYLSADVLMLGTAELNTVTVAQPNAGLFTYNGSLYRYNGGGSDGKDVSLVKLTAVSVGQGYPERMTSIDCYAVENVTTLVQFVIPSTVTDVSANALYSAPGLSGVEIEPGTQTLRISPAFATENAPFVEFIADENDTRFTVVEGALYTKDKTRLVGVPVATDALTLPAETVGVVNDGGYNWPAKQRLTVNNAAFSFEGAYGLLRSGSVIAGHVCSTAELYALKNGYTFEPLEEGVTVTGVTFDVSQANTQADRYVEFIFADMGVTASIDHSDGLSYAVPAAELEYRYYTDAGHSSYNGYSYTFTELGEKTVVVMLGEYSVDVTVTVGPGRIVGWELDTSQAHLTYWQYANGDLINSGVKVWEIYNDGSDPREIPYNGDFHFQQEVPNSYGGTYWSNIYYLDTSVPGEQTLRVVYGSWYDEVTFTVAPRYSVVYDSAGFSGETEQFSDFNPYNAGITSALYEYGEPSQYQINNPGFYAWKEGDEENKLQGYLPTDELGVYYIELTASYFDWDENTYYEFPRSEPICVQVVPGAYKAFRFDLSDTPDTLDRGMGVITLQDLNVKLFGVKWDDTEEALPLNDVRMRYTVNNGTCESCEIETNQLGDTTEVTFIYRGVTTAKVFAVADLTTYSVNAENAQTTFMQYVDTIGAYPGLTVTMISGGEGVDITDDVTFSSVSNLYPGEFTVFVYYNGSVIGEFPVTVEPLNVTGVTHNEYLREEYEQYDYVYPTAYVTYVHNGESHTVAGSFSFRNNETGITYSAYVPKDPGAYTAYAGAYVNGYWASFPAWTFPVTVKPDRAVYTLDLTDAVLETNQYETYGNIQANLRVDRNFDGNVRNYAGYLRYTAPDGQIYYGSLPTDVPGVYTVDVYMILGPYEVTTGLTVDVTVKCVHAALSPVAEVPATCSEDGNTAYWECTVCGALFADENAETEIEPADTVLPGGHITEPVAENEPTCAADGNIACWYCTRCETYFADEAGTDALDYETDVLLPGGHIMEPHEGAQSSCYEDGNLPYNKCLRCGKLFADDEGLEEITDPASVVLPAHHTLTRVPAVPATCTAPGNSEYFTCSECGNWFSDAAGTAKIADKTSVSIPARDHSWGAWTKADDNTHKRVCANDPAHVQTENHAWDGGRVTTSPTCAVNGVRTFTCTVCGATRTENLGTTGHKDDNGDGWCDYGCGTAMGGSTEPTSPGEPSGGDKCPLCGEVHTGFFGNLIGFFHRIAYFFRNLFKR